MLRSVSPHEPPLGPTVKSIAVGTIGHAVVDDVDACSVVAVLVDVDAARRVVLLVDEGTVVVLDGRDVVGLVEVDTVTVVVVGPPAHGPAWMRSVRMSFA